MPLITVSNWRGHERCRALHDAIRVAVLGITELGLTDPNQVTVVFGGEDRFGDPGDENKLFIAVEYLFDREERTFDVRQELASAIGLAAKTVAGTRKVEVVVRTIHPGAHAVDDAIAHPNRSTFWSG